LLRIGTLAAVGAAVLGLSGAASAATPAVALAKQLKTSMQSYYAKGNPGLKITTVTCTIAKDRTSARCHAHFTVVSKHALGVFVVAIQGVGGGNASTKTLSVSCTDSRTGAKRAC
jgi:predicted acyltransferase